jgi:hypothetical protein
MSWCGFGVLAGKSDPTMFYIAYTAIHYCSAPPCMTDASKCLKCIGCLVLRHLEPGFLQLTLVMLIITSSKHFQSSILVS